MNKRNEPAEITEIADFLHNDCMNSCKAFSGECISMPDLTILKKIVDISRSMIFPGCFGKNTIHPCSSSTNFTVIVRELHELLSGQICSSLCLDKPGSDENRMKEVANLRSLEFINQISDIRNILQTDVTATFEGDPAAKNIVEVVYCYPGIRAILNHRIAHALLKMDIPLLPRIISEMAHSETGIDIHPGATIGHYFSIDHGTGVVIGETCIIGDHVKLFQGVTLGAKSFPLDKNGKPVKGIPRHPVVEDNVVIYSNATVLGRITIGKDSVIGGNIWITNDVPPGSKVLQQKPSEGFFANGGGI